MVNFDGLMSHVHFCDGYAYGYQILVQQMQQHSEWKIKTTPV